MPEIPWYMRWLYNYTWPFVTLKMLVKSKRSVSSDKSFLDPAGGSLTGKRTLSMSKQYDLNALKPIWHKIGVSFNDLAMSTIGSALKRLSRDRKENAKQLVCCLVFATRGPPKTPEENKMGNEFGGGVVSVPLSTFIKENSIVVRRKIRESIQVGEALTT